MRIVLFALLAIFGFANSAMAECLKVEDDLQINLSEGQIASLKQISFERKELFDALYDTSIRLVVPRRSRLYWVAARYGILVFTTC
ncbi:MAG: hypothetical protein JNN17_12425 [Verrucomicrobiaceae bacterium]|nr:hypothetical protein [Verrucomicrobiaceae bacterium]